MFPRPCLMLVTDRHQCRGDLVQAVAAAVEGGVHAVQLREKDLLTAELITLGASLKRVMGGAPLLVNDATDVAIAVGADGLHLPENGMSIKPGRLLLPPSALIGRSVHSVQSALAAEAEGADYLIYGNVYETGSHPGAPAAGLDRLREVVSTVKVPVLAIGGVTAARVPEIMAAGAAGVAVISAVLSSPDPRKAASDLRVAVRRAAL